MINHKNTKCGSTALHIQKDIKCLKLLLDYGANIDQGDNNGNSPLIVSYNFEKINFLISRGANVLKKNNSKICFKTKYPLYDYLEKSLMAFFSKSKDPLRLEELF
jgi:ankyrin repeat protein